MHVARAWLLLLLVTAAWFAGCVDPDADDRDGNNGEDVPPAENGDDAVPCHERSPPVARPDEQRVDAQSDLRCSGQYAILDNGTGTQTEVPAWGEGDWWLYRGDFAGLNTGPTCGELHYDVTGDDLLHNASVYMVDVEARDCDGDPEGPARNQYSTQDSLALMRDDGFVRHEFVFPLVDGKRWVFMDLPQDNTGEAQVSHESEYAFDGETLEVWHVKIDGTTHQGDSWEKEIWFSPDARNTLRERMSVNDVEQYEYTLVDSVDGYGEDDGPLPGILPLPVAQG